MSSEDFDLGQFIDRLNPDDFIKLASTFKKLASIRRPEEIEAEFEDKTSRLLHSDLELSEITMREFVGLVFERKGKSGQEFEPFEEVLSYEYQLWDKQKKALSVSRGVDGEEGRINYSGYRMWRYNAVAFYKEGKKALHRLLLKEDEETFRFLENRQFALMSPVTYVGRTNSYRNARFLYAFAFDVDGLGLAEVGWLINCMAKDIMPMANIIVNSGHGFHLYYLLAEPVPMYEKNIEMLNQLKHHLTKLLWTVSRYDNPQYQGVNQGFRMPGTLTKFGKKIRAFYNHDAPMYSIGSLNRYLKEGRLSDNQVLQLEGKIPYDPSCVSLEEAKRRWPEWYAARVIGRKRVGKKWHVNRALYDWWLKQIQDDNKVMIHHRYWCILTLVVYAVKCDIPREEVLRDAYALIPFMESKTESHDNHFTTDDVDDAMRAFDEGYNKWPISTIESTTAIRITRCRRNGRSQEQHLNRARALRDISCAEKGLDRWDENKGRKKETAENSHSAALVRSWRINHPSETNKSLCARETGLTRPTVHKWWNVIDEELVK